MSRINSVAQRMRWLTAAVVLLGVQGCGEDPQKPGGKADVCATACSDPGTDTGTANPPPADACEETAAPDCGDHGVCSEVEQVAVCACDPGYDGEDCSACAEGYVADANGDCGLDATVPFSPDNIFLAWGLFGPADSGRVEVSGKTGADARFNGYYADIAAGSFTQPTYVGIRPASGTGLSFSGNGNLIAASGADFAAVAEGDEYLPLGEGETVAGLNTVQPLKQTGIKYSGFRGTSYSYSTAGNGFTVDPSSTQVADGTVAQLNGFSPHYLVDSPAQMNNAVTEGTGLGEFYFDLSALDEGTADGLTYGLSVTAGTVTQETGSRFRVIFPEGNNAATAVVYDQFGVQIASLVYSINVSAPVLLDNVDVSCFPDAITTGESSQCDTRGYWTSGTDATVDASCNVVPANAGTVTGGTFTPGVFSGNADVSCEYGGMTSADTITISAVRTGVTVVCNPSTVQVGGTVECDAVAQWSDGITTAEDGNCAWSAVTGTVDGTGLYSAPASIASSPATDTVQCDLGGITGTTNVAVNSPKLDCENAGGTYYNNFCWSVAAQTADNCDTVCGNISLTCSADPDWTVDDTLCGQLTSGGNTTGTLDSNYSPVTFIDSQCKGDIDNIRSCSEPATGPYKRICKCE